MAISYEVNTHGLLDRWPIWAQESIWHFNQFTDPSYLAKSGEVYIQDERELIARSINHAYETFARYAGFYPQPTFIEDEIINFFVPNPKANGARDFATQELSTKYGYLREFGTRKATLVNPNPIGIRMLSITNGVPELAEVFMMFDEEKDAEFHSKLRLFRKFLTQFRRSQDTKSNPKAMILPAFHPYVHEGANFAACYIHPALLANESLWATPYEDNSRKEGRQEVITDVNAAGYPDDYSVDRTAYKAFEIYHIDADPTNAVTLLSYRNDGQDKEIIETQASAFIVDKDQGLFKVRLNDNSMIQYPPYAVRVSYLAGKPLVEGNMDNGLESGLMILATTNVSLESSTMRDRTQAIYENYWHELFEDSDSPLSGLSEYQNTLGTRRGHVDAWAVIKEYADRNRALQV